jgi:Big-like domain-containing protein
MRRPLLVLTLAMLAGCDSKSPVAPTVPTPVTPTPAPTPQIASVTIAGDGRFTALNNVRQFTATARMQDGSTRDVTAEATWESSNADVAAVSARGEVTSVGAGLATIFATDVVAGSLDVSVTVDSRSQISGLYRFVVTAAPECAALPDWARRREYDVSLSQVESEHPGTDTALTLTAQLEPGFAPQFDGSIGGSRVRFVFPPATDTGGGGCFYYYYCGRASATSPLWPAFAHTLDTARLYTVWGQATGTKAASHNVQISGTVDGVVTAANPSTNETIAECTSARHQFSLTRQ